MWSRQTKDTGVETANSMSPEIYCYIYVGFTSMFKLNPSVNLGVLLKSKTLQYSS